MTWRGHRWAAGSRPTAASAAQEEHNVRLTRGQLLKRAGLGARRLPRAGPRWAASPPLPRAQPPRHRHRRRRARRTLVRATALKQAGYAADVYEASDRSAAAAGRSAGFRRRPDRRARRRADRPGPPQIRQLAQAARAASSTTCSRARRTAPSRSTTSTARHTRTTRPRTTSRRSGRRSTRTSRRRATRRSATSRPERGRQLDAMSIVDWINESVPGGIGSKLGQLLDVAYNIEYGAESSDQSSLNLLYLLGYQGPGNLRDLRQVEREVPRAGGNDQIPQRLADAIGRADLARAPSSSRSPERRRLRPVALEGRLDVQGDGRPGRPRAAVLDPALVGRLSRRPASSRCKVTRDPGAGDGDELEAPRPVPEAPLERPRLQRRDVLRPRLPEHLGGHARAGRRRRDPRQLHGRQDRRELRQRHAGARASSSSRQIEPVLPGPHGALERQGDRRLLAGYPWTKGSYSYWKVGQYTAFAGIERERGRATATSRASTPRSTSRAT